MELNELQRRELIVRTRAENPELTDNAIAKKLKYHPKTVARVLKRFSETLSIKRKRGSGGKKGPADPKLTQKVLRSITNNPGYSDRERARKFGTSRENIRKIRSRAGLKSYKAIKQPNRHDKQNLVGKYRSRKLYREILTKHNGCIVMDDETYVKLDFKQIPGHKYYVSNFRGSVPNKYKFVLVDKFAPKMMIWQGICSCGRKSRAYVVRGNMNQDVYIKECLTKRLLPFIRSHDCSCIFFPDLASCHYARATLAWYNANTIAFVGKNMNPPNCPEFRPIERYWAIVKNLLNKNGGSCKNAEEMLKKWNYFAGKLGLSDVQKLMGSIKRRVRAFIRNEV